MKICKKCKKNIPNNVKICKYCGSDVSISKTKKKNNIKKTPKIKTELLKKTDLEEKNNTKTELLFTQIYKTDLTKNFKNEETKTELLFPHLIEAKKAEFKKNKKTNYQKQLDTFFTESYQKEADNYYDFTGEITPLKIKNSQNKKQKYCLKDKLNLIKNKYQTVKNKNNQLKKKLDYFKEKDQEQELTKAQQLYLVKKQMQVKKRAKIFILILVLCLVGYLSYKVYDDYQDLGYVIKESDKHSNRMFNMGDIVTYNDISYTIIKGETSKGTSYKKPKEGNQYLIITIRMKNHSKEKFHYSGNYFKMTNSLHEETGKIISPVNAGRALYSGQLVVGGTKEGSLVFEQPIDDKDLKLLVYDQKELEEYEKKIEEQDVIENSDEESISNKIIKPNPIFKVKITVK